MEGWKPQDNGKVPSILSAFDNRRNSENVYTNNLMEKILAKDNMNQACKQVVRNKGKHGIGSNAWSMEFRYLSFTDRYTQVANF
ncbi:MAG TPA: hypothetical protein ENO17_09445 [Candidatus Atribacteria bacterium]|nr:hypothetical protein [Candidatus Atribacteria bacterium]